MDTKREKARLAFVPNAGWSGIGKSISSTGEITARNMRSGPASTNENDSAGNRGIREDEDDRQKTALDKS